VLDELADGILLLDKGGRVRHANAAGQAALDRRDGLLLRDNRLVCRDLRANAELQRALTIAAAAGVAPSGGWVAVPRDDRRALLVQVTTCRGAQLPPLVPTALLMVRVKDPDGRRVPTPALLRELLGLTLGEARAVLVIAATESQDQAAERLGVAKTTLRTHLHHAYQKLGIHNRAELMRLFASYNFRDAGDVANEG
jgi:DNA-binding CsgD family transcriptional regulator